MKGTKTRFWKKRAPSELGMTCVPVPSPAPELVCVTATKPPSKVSNWSGALPVPRQSRSLS